MTKATFIGIGAQKCASTWLYAVLRSLPTVLVSETKEVDFFSSYFDRGFEWYERHFSSSSVATHIGEVSPSYFADIDAPIRAHAYNPQLLVLVCLRDPVERAYSNHLHEVRARHISGANLSFEQALDNNPFYLEQGLYARHLRRWYAKFPARQIHITFQEDVARRPDEEVIRLAKFLGLQTTEPQRSVSRANESLGYKNELIGSSLHRIGDGLRQIGLGDVLESVKLLPGVRQLRAANQRNFRNDIEPMRPETIARLTEFFSPDVASLREEFGLTPPWVRFS